ncbi:MAG TPA: ABC transporter ATP-binding protein [Trueperaceae bacterium]
MSTAAATHTWRNVRRFAAFLKPYLGQLALASAGGIVKFSVPLLVPLATRYLLDQVFLDEGLTTAQKLRQLWLVGGGLIALFALFWAPWVYVRHVFAGLAAQRTVFDLRSSLYYRILRMSASFFTRHKSGSIVTRITYDIDQVQNLVGGALTNVWMDLVSLILVIILLLRIDVGLTVIALVTFPPYLFFFRRFNRRIKQTSEDVQQKVSTLSGNVQEKIAGSTVVRAFGREKTEERHFYHDARRLLTSNLRSVRLQSLNAVVTGLLAQVAPLIVIIYGGSQVISGRLTIGDLVAVTLYLGSLYLPLQRFSDLNVIFANATAALDRVFQVMDEEPDVREKPDAIDIGRVKGEVEFIRVSFAYDPETAPVLREVSFTARPGEKIALVGPSGSGKSTIISLIPRFYDPTDGVVRVDGVDLRVVTLASLRRNVSMVLQSPVLFSGTVRDNLQYGRPRASFEELREACRAANALDFINALPHGFDTEVGEGGAFLSGGQRQRLTIARAFLKDPRILILDEATSALDTASERLIQQSLDKLMEGRTTFVIAHRLSTVVNCDRILVMRAGSVVESGRHEELIAQGGLYAELFSQTGAAEVAR